MITGFLPGDLNLYELSVTHKSACINLPDGTSIHNERLEYLGDAVLDVIIADYLYLKFPEKGEGFLTQLRSKIVKRKELKRGLHPQQHFSFSAADTSGTSGCVRGTLSQT